MYCECCEINPLTDCQKGCRLAPTFQFERVIGGTWAYGNPVTQTRVWIETGWQVQPGDSFENKFESEFVSTVLGYEGATLVRPGLITVRLKGGRKLSTQPDFLVRLPNLDPMYIELCETGILDIWKRMDKKRQEQVMRRTGIRRYVQLNGGHRGLLGEISLATILQKRLDGTPLVKIR
jgi:hypothetical protein